LISNKPPCSKKLSPFATGDIISHVTIGLLICGFLLVVNMNRPCISHGRWHIELQRFWGYNLDILWSRDVICHVTTWHRYWQSDVTVCIHLCALSICVLPALTTTSVRSLTVEAAKTLVQAFIACRLDYCNSLVQDVSNGLMRKVQLVQNAVAPLPHHWNKTLRPHHARLRQLHWLPVRQRMTFKLACLVSGNAPMYPADDIHLLSERDRHQLRSSSSRTCIVPRTHKSYGDRSFAATGPRLWNSLPS